MESFIYFLFGLIASVLINLATPYMQKVLEGRSLVNKGKKLKTLQEELNYISELERNANRFSATILGDVLILTGLVTLLIVTVALALYAQILSLHLLSFNNYDFFGKFVNSRNEIIVLSNNLQVVSQIIYAIVFSIAILITSITVNSSRRIRKVRQFDRYKTEMDEQIVHLQQVARTLNKTE